MNKGIQPLPPKMAAQFADRARRMDGCVLYGDAYQFAAAQGGMVTTLMFLDPPTGYVMKDAPRAEQIRAELAGH